MNAIFEWPLQIELPDFDLIGWSTSHHRLSYPNGIWDRAKVWSLIFVLFWTPTTSNLSISQWVFPARVLWSLQSGGNWKQKEFRTPFLTKLVENTSESVRRERVKRAIRDWRRLQGRTEGFRNRPLFWPGDIVFNIFFQFLRHSIKVKFVRWCTFQPESNKTENVRTTAVAVKVSRSMNGWEVWYSVWCNATLRTISVKNVEFLGMWHDVNLK